MKVSFLDDLICPRCRSEAALTLPEAIGATVAESVLRCSCGFRAPVIAGVPRLLPEEAERTLPQVYPGFYERYPELTPAGAESMDGVTVRTLRAFADEWQRFPEVLAVHRKIFDWYLEGPEPVRWAGLRVLDAGCGMGRWLHFALQEGAEIVGMDVSPAIDVAAAREGEAADFVQADLREPPFPPESFDLVYCFGVLHHLEDPAVGVRSLASLVKPDGELRLYVYRTLDDEPLAKRVLLRAVTALRRVTTRLPYAAVHAVAWLVAATAECLFLTPRRVLRRWSWGDPLTRGLPLVHYTEVPFRMLVAEQFDRLVAPIEGRYRKEDLEEWLKDIGFDVVAVMPGLGWRVIGRRPAATE